MIMDRARKLFQSRRRPSYEPLAGSLDADDIERPRSSSPEEPRFYWIEYGVFVLLGIAMLWAWNMFLAAAPYFQRRFRSNKTILANFQATEVSIATLANLGSMIILAKLQANASYTRRVATSLLIYIVAYVLLAISTRIFLNVSADGYFAFFVIMVFISSTATGFMQNGTFAFASGFGRQEYMQGIMAGQAIAGVLPPIVQIASVLSAGEAGDDGSGRQQSSTAAFAYFLTATCISALTLLSFLYLVKRHRRAKAVESVEHSNGRAYQSDDESSVNVDRNAEQNTTRKTVPLRTLARKLLFPALAVFTTFAVTMVYPVFTQEIISTNPLKSPLFRDAAFIPFAFLIWNAGDLLGRLIPLVPRLSLALRPRILFLLAVLRFLFIPLYLLCNMRRPASSSPSEASLPIVKSDLFYLLVVQFPFGVSNGYIGSCCMMGAGDCVEEDEREATGGFMAVFLVGGLAVGSLCSFFIGNAA